MYSDFSILHCMFEMGGLDQYIDRCFEIAWQGIEALCSLVIIQNARQ